MKLEDILTNLEITCSQNHIKSQDVMILYILDKLDLYDDTQSYRTSQQQVDNFKMTMIADHDLLWDLQPTLEDDEDHAFAVQHARDIYNILVGRDLC